MDRKALALRVGSAAVLLPVVLLVVYLGGLWFTFMIAVAGALMGYEWNRMCGGGIDVMLGVFAATVVPMACLTGRNEILGAWVALACGLLVTLVVASVLKRSIGWALSGLIYIGVPVLALVWLRVVQPEGLKLVFWILCVVWAADTGAFFAGSAIGGPKLAPAISPNKTWSGAIGGLVGASLVGLGFAIAVGVPIAVAMIASVLVGFAAELGDLQESWIKRRLNTKDSGSLIPGHGGLLDRLDSLLFAAPVVCLMILLPDQPWFYL